MEYQNQANLHLPCAYAVLSEEEMTYIEGGAFSINITQEQVATFAANLIFNTLYVLGRGTVDYVSTTIQNGRANGLSYVGIIDHQLNKMSPWSKVAATGLLCLGGYYVYTQVVGIVRNVAEIVKAIQNAYNQSQQPALEPSTMSLVAA